MNDRVTLDRVAADDQYDFTKMYNDYVSHLDDEVDETPIMDLDKSKYYSPDEFNQLKYQMGQNALSAFCVNCQSVTAHWDAIIDLVSKLNSNLHALDLIGLTEIFKINSHTNYEIAGYHPILYKTRTDSNRGGIGLYINETMTYTIREDLSLFIPHVYESLFVEIHVTQSRNIICGIIYRPSC